MSILYEKKGKIALVTLNRPEVLNAINRQMIMDLSNVWEDFKNDSDLFVMIVTGAGEKAFCTGGDIRERCATGDDPHAAGWLDRVLTPMRITDMFKPVIAAINGYCLGGGLELALSCDLRLASGSATFGQPEIKRGIFPGQGATQRLTRILPYHLAAELIFTGEAIDARKALQLGLINRLVEARSLMKEAWQLAGTISEKPPLALRAAKEALLKSYDLSLVEGLRYEGELRKKVGITEDAREGIAAFMEKRKPIFKGA